MAEKPAGMATRLLRDWRSGKKGALEQLMPLVHQELHRLAKNQMRSERTGHTLQTTALVNEAFIRLVDVDVSWHDRAHFLALSARLMRRILVDHARSRSRLKRGGSLIRLTLDEAIAAREAKSLDLLALDEALGRLAVVDERQSQIVELKYFGGLRAEEIAETLGITSKRVYKDLAFAKGWLYRELSSKESNE